MLRDTSRRSVSRSSMASSLSSLDTHGVVEETAGEVAAETRGDDTPKVVSDEEDNESVYKPVIEGDFTSL